MSIHVPAHNGGRAWLLRPLLEDRGGHAAAQVGFDL
jgi:hypothetical protein